MSGWSNTEVIDQYSGEDGFYLYIPEKTSGEVVVFIHGYGALNPMIYGGWLNHLLSKGHIIIYPRYQDKILGTKARFFADHVVNAVHRSQEILSRKGVPLQSAFHYLGHSYGGTITAYLGLHYEKYKLQKPASLMMCQPGTGPLNALRENSYNNMDPAIPFSIIVGSEDKTVGESLGRIIYNTAEESYSKVFVRHLPSKELDPPIKASHYEPYSVDTLFDNHIVNYTLRKCLKNARTDEVDHLYWNIFDQQIENPESLFDLESGVVNHTTKKNP